MEMGQPAAGATPEMWVRSLEYTGRVVAVSNAQVCDEPVFNYSRDFPYLWDEISVPVGYDADRALTERILLEVANTRTVRLSDVSGEALRAMRRRYFVRMEDLRPKVYTRITDNWLELTVRFVVEVRGVRDFNDAMNREILHRFDEVGIPIASSTMVVTQIAAPPPSPHPADLSRTRARTALLWPALDAIAPTSGPAAGAQVRAIAVTVAPIRRARSAGASTISTPRRPALT